MFDPEPHRHVFALPPGVDFPLELISGLRSRLSDAPPETMARVDLIVNTRRMARRLRTLFDQGPPGFLPRISLLTDVQGFGPLTGIPPASSPLRRRLELAQLIDRLLTAQPDLAARDTLFDLADSLATLLDEMQGEGVSVDTIRALDVSDMSGHWERAKTFIGIVDDYLGQSSDQIDPQARQRQMIEALIATWQTAPPSHPVILAGSTGSRGTTLLLMQAIAQLPQGALVLPGFDFEQPARVWEDMTDALVSEDHPQFRFSRIMETLNIGATDVRAWTNAEPPSSGRNRLVSLALRAAPFTDAWLEEGPALADLAGSCADMTLIEASGPREEALVIAMRLRQAAEDGSIAALITPDRMLTRRVAAALDRWGILADDSAGLPLQLSPPGRFLRHVARLFSERLTSEALMALLKHPLCHSGPGRGEHLLHTRDLEISLRKHGPPFPDRPCFHAFGKSNSSVSTDWIDWLCAHLTNQPISDTRPLRTWVENLRHLAERLAGGSDTTQTGGLWEKKAGESALRIMQSLEQEADRGAAMNARDFGDLLGSLLAGEEVRDRDAPHPHILIWGTLEARVQGADLLILGGLNEGSWPEVATPDPWLNRSLRMQAGLLLPERRIGLSAHDFQQAIAAKQVWLTRARQSDDAETVPSRWLNRLTNLLSGLPPEGPRALDDMRERGAEWLTLAQAAEQAPAVPSALRPSPRPPVAARPRQMSVTEIKRLIRDPYAVYARHVLGLRPIDPLAREPDALLRGIVVHEVLEKFVKLTLKDPETLHPDAMLTIAEQILAQEVPWPMAQRLWAARVNRFADAFVQNEQERQERAQPLEFEAEAALKLAPLDFTLTGRADRIDRDEDGQLIIYDYKTGSAPSKSVQKNFDKQLLIETVMAQQGAFKKIPAGPVKRAVFIGLGTGYTEVDAPLDEEPPEQVLNELRELIASYLSAEQGFSSRRAMQKDSDPGDFDHLARFGEWDRSSMAIPEDLT